MGLYKRKDSSVYWISYTYKGKRYFKSTNTSDIKTAEKIEKMLQAKIALDQWHPESQECKKENKEHTFRELAKKYAEYAHDRQKSYRRWKSYIVKFLVDYFKGVKINHITLNDIEKLQSQKLKVSVYVANRTIAVLSAMLHKAFEWDMIDESVILRLKKIKSYKEKSRMRCLSYNEIQKLISFCSGQIRDIVIFALNTGMRKGEILELKWNDIDFTHGFITIKDSKNGESRQVPINDNLKSLLIALPSRFLNSYVFGITKGNKIIKQNDIKRAFTTATQRAGFTDVRFHDLRHTFASHLAMQGVDITTISRLMGHKSLKMTLRYAHLTPGHFQSAVQKLDAVLKSAIN